MKKIVRLLICILSISCIVFDLVGCQKKSSSDDIQEILLEKTKIILPDDYTNVFHITEKSESEVYVVLGKDNAQSVWIWNLHENKWELFLDINEVLAIDDSGYCYADVSNNGEVFIVYSEKEQDNIPQNEKYYYIDSNTNVYKLDFILPQIEIHYAEELAEIIEIDVEKIVNSVALTKLIDDQLFIVDYNNTLYRIDKTSGAILSVYKTEEEWGAITDISLDGEQLTVLYNMGIATFELETEKMIVGEMETIVADLIKENPTYSHFYFIKEKNGMETSFLLDEQIYCLTHQQEVVAYTKLRGLSSSQTQFISDFVACDKSSFVALCQKLDSGESLLYQYSVKTEEDSSGDCELTVWTLRDSMDVQNLVTAFEGEFPHVNINVEVGMSDEDGRTVSDAINNLNTMLLAGDGPDVIFLDQVPFDHYIENGLLLNLESTINEIEHENHVFSNIIRTMESDRGVYVVPSRYVMLGETGTKEQIEKSKDIVKWMQDISDEESQQVIGSSQVESIIQNLYYVESKKWVVEGQVDKEKIEDFFTVVGDFCSCIGKTKLNLGSEEFEPEITVNYYEVGTKRYDLAYDYIVDFGYQVQGMKAVAELIDGSYEFPASGFENTFIPTNIVGISSQSENIDMAKELLKLQFSTNVQKQSSGKGNPTNKDAFLYSIDAIDIRELEYEEGVVFSFTKFSDKEIQNIIAQVEQLNEPLVRDGILMDLVFEQIENYIEGSVTKEEAVDVTCEKMKLYLSER